MELMHRNLENHFRKTKLIHPEYAVKPIIQEDLDAPDYSERINNVIRVFTFEGDGRNMQLRT